MAHAVNAIDVQQAVSRIKVYPEQAQKWLEGALRNRNIAPAAVARYCKDMENDNWQVNGETLKFAGMIGSGLVDGRHRLSACVKAGRPFTTWAICNVLDYSEVDTGKRRTLSEALSISREGLSTVITQGMDASMCFLIGYARASRAKSIGHISLMTHRERLDFLCDDADMAVILPVASEYMEVKRGQVTPLRPSVALTLLWFQSVAKESLEPIHQFLRQVRDGVGLEGGNAALAYRNLIINSNIRGRSLTTRQVIYTAINTIGNHLSGTRMMQCKVPSFAEFPGVDPEQVRAILGI